MEISPYFGLRNVNNSRTATYSRIKPRSPSCDTLHYPETIPTRANIIRGFISWPLLYSMIKWISNQFRQVCCPYFLCELCIQCRPLCDVSLLIVHIGMKLQPVLLEEISEVRVILICHCCQRPTRRRASAGCRNNSSMHDRASGRTASTELRIWNRSAASEDR